LLVSGVQAADQLTVVCEIEALLPQSDMLVQAVGGASCGGRGDDWSRASRNASVNAGGLLLDSDGGAAGSLFSRKLVALVNERNEVVDAVGGAAGSVAFDERASGSGGENSSDNDNE
jgi:hypothetical protein